MSSLPEIQPHTLAKHHILKYYLDEWFPILGRRHHSLRYIDGFAGPGEYEGGQLGSPLIALHTVWAHSHFQEFSDMGKKVDFLFVEKNRDFFENLANKIYKNTWPGAISPVVRHGEFEEIVSRLIEDISGLDTIPPTLAFIDPFGPAGFSMSLLERLASFPRMEVLINLNHNEFVRWLPDRSKHITADRLFGGSRWRPALSLAGRERSKFLVDEYEAALREVGWRGTNFEMVNSQNQTAYHLVFGTGNSKGLEAMKRAMRAASPTGEFRYTDRLDSRQQLIPGMDIAQEHAEQIAEDLFQKYEGHEIAYSHLVEEEIEWHGWRLESDLRKGLSFLENGEQQRISGVRTSDGRTRRKGDYPSDCLITFDWPMQPKLI